MLLTGPAQVQILLALGRMFGIVRTPGNALDWR